MAKSKRTSKAKKPKAAITNGKPEVIDKDAKLLKVAELMLSAATSRAAQINRLARNRELCNEGKTMLRELFYCTGKQPLAGLITDEDRIYRIPMVNMSGIRAIADKAVEAWCNDDDDWKEMWPKLFGSEQARGVVMRLLQAAGYTEQTVSSLTVMSKPIPPFKLPLSADKQDEKQYLIEVKLKSTGQVLYSGVPQGVE